MSITRLKVKRVLPILKENRRAFASLVEDNEYTNSPQYPPILDTSSKAEKLREKKRWHKKIESLKTVEEKLFAINLPKYYGWHSLMLKEATIPYNSLPLTQFITRTHCIDELPEYYKDANIVQTTEKTLLDIKSKIEEALVIEHGLHGRHEDEKLKKRSPTEINDAFGRSVVQQVNRIILASIASDHPHVLESHIDLDPRIEAFWTVGQIEPPANVRISKEKNDRVKDSANEPIDRHVQYLGRPILAMRSPHPLYAPVALQSYAADEMPVERFTWDPRVLGVDMEYRHGTTVPGFWPGDGAPFGLVSFHSSAHLAERPVHYKDTDKCLKVQAVLAGFGWTFAQACYQGFSTFSELTYPLASQTVVTDGQHWSCSAFQLNTTLLHSENAVDNPRRNLCWEAPNSKLFEEIQGDKVIGFNIEALRTVVQFYANVPAERPHEMQPFLDADASHVADIADDERRVWLEEHYKHLVSNRPRARLPYEIYDWEHIYKIAHNTRPLDKKRRPFELGERPYQRRLDEHHPKYIPKKLRPEDPKNRNKFSKTYYP